MSKLTSNQITFIDLTDTRTFKVYLQASVPTAQIYNKNNGSFQPSWEYQNLTIMPEVYLNSALLPLSTNGLTITWQRSDGIDSATALSQEQGEYSLSNRMTVTKNALASSLSGMITYICTVRYNNLEAVGKITFCRIDHGEDAAAPTLLNTQALDGTRSQITLAQSIVAFEYLEIYYHTIQNDYSSIRIRHVGREDAKTLIYLPLYENDIMYQCQAELSISNTTASMLPDKNLRYNPTTNKIEKIDITNPFVCIDAIYGIK